MSIEFITITLLLMLEISIREKHRILTRSVLSPEKTPQTNKEAHRYKVTAREVLSTIWLVNGLVIINEFLNDLEPLFHHEITHKAPGEKYEMISPKMN